MSDPLLSSQNVAGFVLAGGRSSRMGTDKAFELFAGIPLIQNAVRLLTSVGAIPAIAGSRSLLSAFAPEIPDSFPDAGPLGGIHAALSASRTEWNVFLPVDMPLMPPSLLACLIQRARLTGSPVTAVLVNGRLEPFPVVLSRDTLPQITHRLQSGQNACHAAWRAIPKALGLAIDTVSVEHLVSCGQAGHPLQLPPVFWFRSANTPDDLAYLNRLGAHPRLISRVS